MKPWLKWYPTDWRADPALRMCSLTARGLWIELLGYMHEADPYGHLVINGKAPTEPQIAVLVGVDVKTVRASLTELADAGVPSFTESGVIFSRRMVRDADKAQHDSDNGKGGGNPKLCGKVMAGVNPPLKAQKSEARLPETSKANTARKRATSLPDGFAMSHRVAQWATEKGHTRLAERLEHFTGYARRNGKTYIDWDEALMSAIREDWAKLNRPMGHSKADKIAAVAESMHGNLTREINARRDDIPGEFQRSA